MEGKQHASVVAAIKEGGDDTKLLVVDVLTDEFFKKCKVVPSEAHLAGGSSASAAGSPRPQALGICLGAASEGWERGFCSEQPRCASSTPR